MQNKLFIALLGTLGINTLTPSLAANIDATYAFAAPNWFLMFAAIFSACFVVEKGYNVYAKYKK